MPNPQVPQGSCLTLLANWAKVNTSPGWGITPPGGASPNAGGPMNASGFFQGVLQGNGWAITIGAPASPTAGGVVEITLCAPISATVAAGWIFILDFTDSAGQGWELLQDFDVTAAGSLPTGGVLPGSAGATPPGGLYYGVTSGPGLPGTWFLVNSGRSAEAVRQNAISLLMGSAVSTTVLNYTAQNATPQQLVDHLRVLQRHEAAALVGARGIQAFEGSSVR